MDQRVSIPHIMGHEACGTVIEVGSKVTHINIGDFVAVMPL